MAKYAYTVPFDADNPWNKDPVLVRDEATGGLISITTACIRIDPVRKLYVHSNSAHYNRGVKGLWISDAGDLYVDMVGDDPVLSIDVSCDETISGERGIIGGGSGGTNDTRIVLFDTVLKRSLNLAVDADFARVASSGSNIWFKCMREVTA